MLRLKLFILSCLAAAMTTASPGVGLVLSGGGCKGIAHIGFIQAMEERGIPIDYITGTSMGAIVGSLYASGYTPQEMMALLQSPAFLDWSSGKINPSDNDAFYTPAPTMAWLQGNFSIDATPASLMQILPTRLINPLPMSLAFMNLYARQTGACGGDFDRLMVPLRTVASDIYRHRSVVFSHGQLADAVRASMSFPFVFQPIEVDGTLLFDGGLYDNYPVNVMMQQFDPRYLVGINVGAANTPPQLNNMISQIEDMVTNNITYPFPDERGVSVRINVERFGLLNWGAAQEIYDIGYREGVRWADSLAARIPQRRTPEEVAAMRRAFRARMQPLHFDDVTVTGGTLGENAFIASLFRAAQGESATLDEEQTRRAFYSNVSTGRMRNLVPHALYTDSGVTLSLRADVTPPLSVALGGYLTSSTGSLIYASAAYAPLQRRRLGVSLQGWAGQSYLAAQLQAGMLLGTTMPSRLTLRALVARTRYYQTENMFWRFSEPSFMHTRQEGAALGWHLAAGRHAVATLEAGYTHDVTSYNIARDGADGGFARDVIRGNRAFVTLRYRLSTLDDATLPFRGSRLDLWGAATAGREWYTPSAGAKVAQRGVQAGAAASWMSYFPLSQHFALATGIDARYTSQPLWPTYAAAIAAAPQYSPVMSQYDLMDPAFRANQYVVATVQPIVRISLVQIGVRASLFNAIRPIEEGAGGTARYGDLLSRPRFDGELWVGAALRRFSVRAYAGYRDSPATRWSAGISLGLYLPAEPLVRE